MKNVHIGRNSVVGVIDTACLLVGYFNFALANRRKTQNILNECFVVLLKKEKMRKMFLRKM